MNRARDLLGGKRRRCRDELSDIAKRYRRRARDAIDGGVGIRVREGVALAVLAGIDLQGDAIPRAKEVAVHEVAVQAEFLGFRIADAAAELTRQSFLDVEVDIHQIGAACHRLVFELDFLNVRQTLQALLGALHG